MKCINLKIRSKKYVKYFYCSLKKEEIQMEKCIKCENKEYKKVVKMQKRSSKRAKALDISIDVRETVFKRDKGLCVVCKSPGLPNSHYIARGKGGLGIEQNVLTHCMKCHHEYDNGKDLEKAKYIKEVSKKHLMSIYKNWNEEDLIYKKNV